jgi:large subunit ribosomal protein L25
MERIELKAQTRTVQGKKVKQIRAEGWTPAVLFGAKIPSTSIQVEERELTQALSEAGSTSLINLIVDDKAKPHVVIAREIQRDILSGRLQHVDFYQVQLDQKIKTTPMLEIVGETPLIRTGGAILNHILNQVEVECLPTDLIDSIPVDISVLESIDDTITIGDLPVPKGVTILADPEDVVVSVMVPRMAAEEEEVEVEAEVEYEVEEAAEFEPEADAEAED